MRRISLWNSKTGPIEERRTNEHANLRTKSSGPFEGLNLRVDQPPPFPDNLS